MVVLTFIYIIVTIFFFQKYLLYTFIMHPLNVNCSMMEKQYGD